MCAYKVLVVPTLAHIPQGVSPSLKRARKPFLTRNLLTGASIVLFATSVYWYSIAAVKQDDFSDVADLLPPLDERAKLKSIEDEEAERRSKQKAQFGADDTAVSSSQSLAASAEPSSSKFGDKMKQAASAVDSVVSALPASPIRPPAGGEAVTRRSGEIMVLPFVQGRFGRSSIVNGQVDVDRIGTIWDDGVGGTRRQV